MKPLIVMNTDWHLQHYITTPFLCFQAFSLPKIHLQKTLPHNRGTHCNGKVEFSFLKLSEESKLLASSNIMKQPIVPWKAICLYTIPIYSAYFPPTAR